MPDFYFNLSSHFRNVLKILYLLMVFGAPIYADAPALDFLGKDYGEVQVLLDHALVDALRRDDAQEMQHILTKTGLKAPLLHQAIPLSWAIDYFEAKHIANSLDDTALTTYANRFSIQNFRDKISSNSATTQKSFELWKGAKLPAELKDQSVILKLIVSGRKAFLPCIEGAPRLTDKDPRLQFLQRINFSILLPDWKPETIQPKLYYLRIKFSFTTDSTVEYEFLTD